MKNTTFLKIASLFILLLSAQISFGQTILTYDNFNQGFGNWNSTGGYSQRLGSGWSSCLNGDDTDSGAVSVRLRDDTSSSRLISDQYDFSSYSQVKITYNFATSTAPESGEGWFIEYSDDNGGNWETVKQYINGVNFTENQCVSNEEVLIEPSSTINFNSSQILLRFRNNMNHKSEQLWLDNIKVEGFSGTDILFYENFSDDTDSGDDNDFSGTDDSGNQIGWTANVEGSADKWEISGDKWKGKEVETESSFTTDPFSISTYSDLQFQFYVEFKDLEDTNSEWIKVFYTIDGGTEQTLVEYLGDNTDQTYTVDLPSDAVGDDIVLRIEMHHDSTDEHKIDNIKLIGVVDCNEVSNEVTDAAASVSDTQATLTWANPNATCYDIDEVLVVAKHGSAVTTSPSGDGSDYTASATFGFGDAFDGGFVVYKGGAETVTITGLVNFVTYHATLFTRSGTTWSSGETVLVTPSVSENLFYEDFSDDTSSGPANDFSGTDDSGNQIGWTANVEGSADKWEISGDKWKGKEVETESSFTTNPFSISGYSDLQFQFYVEFKDLEDTNSEWIKVFYTIDGGTEQTLVEYLGDNTDQTYTVDLPSDAVGDDIVLRIEMHHDSTDEHKIDNIKLIGSPFYNVWQGAQDDLVTTNSNWSKESVPTATSNVLVPSTKHLTLEDDIEFNAIKVESSANVTIEKTGSLTTIGDFTKIAGTGAVTLNSDATEFASIIVEGTATGDITYNKYVNYQAYQEWDLVGSPVLNQNMETFAQTNTTVNGTINQPNGAMAMSGDYYALGQYLTQWGSYSNYTTSTIPDANFPAGKGYQMGTNPVGSESPFSGQTLAFTGEIATASQSIDVQNLNGTNNGYGRRWNLVANPYPSYISAEAFFATNSSVMGGAYTYCYVWRTGDEEDNNEDNGGFGKWGIYNMLQNNLGGDDFQIAPGQAFYVAAASADVAQIQFTPSMRTVTGGDDFINGAPVLLNYKLDLKLYNGSTERAKTKFHFQQGLTLGLEPAYDAAAYDQAAALSSRLPEDDQGVNFQLNAMNIEAAYNQTIPLVVNQQEGQSFRISISNNTLPEDINVYLEDVFNGTLTSLKNQDFELVAQEDLSQDGRFYIRFTTESLAVNDVLSPSSITVFKLNTDNFITIKGLSPEMGRTSAAIYNMLGMKVREKALDSSQSAQQISTQGLASGVYIITLTAGEQAVSKKVIIQ